MTTGFQRESAKLYEFPSRIRLGTGGHRAEAKASAAPKAPEVCSTAFGSGWYHEAAMRDQDRTLKP